YQQGSIVVGDIDPDYIEGKIKEIFSDIQMPANAAERVYEPVPDTPGTIYAIGADKEMNLPIALIFFKSKERLLPDEMRPTMAFFAVNYMTSMVQTMLNNRLDEIAQKPDAPFAAASIEIGDFFISKTKDALQLQVVPKGDDFDAAIKAAYGEVLRATRNGFTVGEYERAKSQYLANMEKAAAQADKTDNTQFAREYVRHFADAEPIPGAKLEYEIAKQFSMVPLEQLNKLLPELVQDTDNRVVLVMMPEAEGFTLPTEEALAATIANAEAAEYEAYTDQMKAEPLIPNLPAAVKPSSVKNDEKFGTTVVTYPNGLTLILKPTKNKANEIRFEAIAKGGFSTLDPSQADNVKFLQYSMMNHGLGDYTALDLQKYMQGKQSSLNVGIDAYSVELTGNTTPKDLKTLMELIYMNLTDFQITEEEFAATQAQISSVLANQENNPQYIFGKEFYSSQYTSPLKQVLSVDAVKGADRQGTLDIIHSMLAHPSRFTMVFVGDINMDEFMPLADQYLGSIRADRSMPVPFVTNPAFEPTLGAATITKTTKMETPQTWVAITAGATLPYTAKNRVLSTVAAQILSKRLLKTIREDMGAVYSIGAGGSMSRLDKENAMLQIPFPMKPEMKDEVITAIKGMLNDMTVDVKDEELAPVKEFMVKEVISARDDNQKIAATLSAITLNGVDTVTDAEATINGLTTDDVKDYMKALLGADNLRIFVLDPAE
ncbi:MAG: insulinase family protein, partial [Muribaculaceae bacterium]|nr:insulinase family protein [Muribaculaceae bacterium]